MKPLPFYKDEIERSIPARFERIAEILNQRTAVKSIEREFTYGELNKLADRLVQYIRRHSGLGQEPVVLLFRHEATIVPAILGVLKTGRAYVALDPGIPSSRSGQIFKHLQPCLIITNTNNLLLANTLVQDMYPVFNIDQLDQDYSGIETKSHILPNTTAAIFYTSGTTGRPKGVERSHQFILHRIWIETNEYHIRPDDIISLIHNFSFSASQTDLFDALLNGATLRLYDIKKNGIERLIPWLKEEQITFFHTPSDLFRRFLELLTENDFFPNLRQITPAGRLYKKDVERIRKHVPEDCLLIQRLASTETGMITHFKIDKNTELRSNVIPVGYDVEDQEVLILNEAGEPLDFNNVGEIAVKSRYLASGYWKRPDLTQKTFIPVRDGSDRYMYRLGDLGRKQSDGCLELIGRKDFQVKIRGYRIELGEIEAVLLDLEIIKEAVVIAQELDIGENRIVAYVVPADQVKITTSHLRRALSEKLPDYMVPSIFVPLKKLPLTDRNKIDRDALPDPGYSRPELDVSFVAPQTPAEKMLARIWSEILNIEQVGIHDNFIDLGGHSLLAFQIVARVYETFGIDIPVRELFEAATIGSMAVNLSIYESKRIELDKLTKIIAELDAISDEEARKLAAEMED